VFVDEVAKIVELPKETIWKMRVNKLFPQGKKRRFGCVHRIVWTVAEITKWQQEQEAVHQLELRKAVVRAGERMPTETIKWMQKFPVDWDAFFDRFKQLKGPHWATM